MRLDFGNIWLSPLLNARRAPEPKPVSLAAFLDAVERGQYAGKIETLRGMSQQLGRGEIEKSTYQKWKLNNLEGVTVAGVFEGERKGPNLGTHSGICVVDLDSSPDEPLDLEYPRACIEADEHVCFAFLSPGGEGFKAGVVVGSQDDAAAHKHAFSVVKTYIRERYNLEIDPSGSDVARVCYVSYDPHAFRNPHATPLPIPEPPPRQRRAHSSTPPDADGAPELPGDDLNERATADWWAELLERHGWSHERDDDATGISYWCRPGKDSGVSASVGWQPDAEHTEMWLHVWSSNAEPLEPGWHSPLNAYALLEHGGDWGAAARALREQGYGNTEAPQKAVRAGFGEIPFGSGTFGKAW
jgi:hypothetical protein